MLFEGVERPPFACGAAFEVEESVFDAASRDELVEVVIRLGKADERKVVKEQDDPPMDLGWKIREYFARRHDGGVYCVHYEVVQLPKPAFMMNMSRSESRMIATSPSLLTLDGSGGCLATTCSQPVGEHE